MTLEEVIAQAYEGPGPLKAAALNPIALYRIANAVRAFLGSPEVAKAVIDAYDGGLVREPADNTPSGMRVRFLPVKAMRAALSSIGG